MQRYSDDQLILAARLYFIDGLPQAQIGKLVNVSQSKVSRMLALARERGIVRVTVPEYEPRNTALERELKQRYDIDAVVIRSAAGLRVQDLRQNLGYFAAAPARQWIEQSRVVAVAGGRAMQALVEHMNPPAAAGELVFAQAMGNIDSTPGPFDAVELARILAQRWKGRFLTLNTPAILPDAETCRRFRELPQIRQVMDRVAQADLAFVGIGTLENSVFVERKVFAPGDLQALRKARAAGEILGRFYDASGHECSTPLRDRVISLRLEELRRIRRVVAVIAGADRAAAAVAAIRGGLVKAFLIDEGGAAAILEQTP